MKTHIINARLVDSTMDTFGTLTIENGLIADVTNDNSKVSDNDTIINAKGCYIMPAFCDLHAHFRDPGLTYKEDIESGSKASVRGGYTSVNLMANTSPVASSMETVRYVEDKAKSIGLVDITQTVSMTHNFDWQTIEHLDFLSNVRFISDDGRGSPIDNYIMLKIMDKAKANDLLILSHAEDYGVSNDGDRLSENLMTARDLVLSEHTGCPVHICHVSTKEAVAWISSAKSRNVKVTCEVTPHHISLTDDIPYKVAPLLRKESDRLALISALKSGVIDIIATDHAPHSKEDKEKGAKGMIGIELAFSICNTYLVETGELSLSDLSRLMSENPSKLSRLNKGLLKPGYEADIVFVDKSVKREIKEESIVSRSCNTPFCGHTLIGDVVATMKKGKFVYGEF